VIKLFKTHKVVFYMLFLIILHTIFNFILIPFHQLVNENPIYQDDYSVHFYRALVMRRMLSESKAAWGYDPYFMAGYPVGTVMDTDNKSTGLVVWLFSFLGPARAYKFYVFFIYLAIPIIIYLAAKNFDLTEFEAAIASTLALLFWYFCDWIDSVPMWGAFSFTFVSYISVFSFSLFYKFLKTGKVWDFIIFCLVSAWTISTHVLVLFCLILPIAFTYLIGIKGRGRKFHLLMLIWVVWIGLTNSFWIFPLLKFLHFKTATKILFKSMGLRHIYSKPVTNLMLPLAWAGIFVWALEKKLIKAFSLLFICLFLMVVTAYGSHLPVFDDLEPLRFFMPLAFYASIPAAKGINFILQFMKRGLLSIAKSTRWISKLGQRPIKIIFLFLVLVIFSLQFFNLIGEGRDCLYQEIMSGGGRLEADLPPEGWAIINWIRENTTSQGRILIEDSSTFAGAHKYFGTHLPALLPWYTNREFIGGPLPGAFIKHHFADFMDGVLFQKNLRNYSPSLLKAYFDTYNIKWIIAWSHTALVSFKRQSSYITHLHTIGDFSFYQVERPPSFFLKGSGKIKADYNKISITEVSPGEVVIKYHWLSTLKTKPPLKIEPFPILDDPIGFIKIYNGQTRNFEIYNCAENAIYQRRGEKG